MRTIHLAILDADIPARELYNARGLYSAQFRDILSDACSCVNAGSMVEDIPAALRVSAWDIRGDCYPPYEILRQRPPCVSDKWFTSSSTTSPGHALGLVDAILVTGSAPGVYEIQQHPWMQTLESYIRTVFQRYPDVRILGSCFGHQIIANTILPKSSPSHQVHVEKCPLGREVGIYEVHLNQKFISTSPVLEKLQGKLRLQMMHGDWVLVAPKDSDKQIKPLPSPWQNIGSSVICPIQGLYYPGRVLTVQGHFELDAFAMIKTCEEFGPLLKWSELQMASYLKQVGPDIRPRQDDAETLAEAIFYFLAGIELNSAGGA